MSKPKEEQRSTRRVPAEGPVTVKVVDGAAIPAAGQLRDASMRGVFIYLARPVSLGSKLELVLPLPSGDAEEEKWIRCNCRVVRVEDSGGNNFGVAAMIENYQPLDETDVPKA